MYEVRKIVRVIFKLSLRIQVEKMLIDFEMIFCSVISFKVHVKVMVYSIFTSEKEQKTPKT